MYFKSSSHQKKIALEQKAKEGQKSIKITLFLEVLPYHGLHGVIRVWSWTATAQPFRQSSDCRNQVEHGWSQILLCRTYTCFIQFAPWCQHRNCEVDRAVQVRLYPIANCLPTSENQDGLFIRESIQSFLTNKENLRLTSSWLGNFQVEKRHQRKLLEKWGA